MTYGEFRARFLLEFRQLNDECARALVAELWWQSHAEELPRLLDPELLARLAVEDLWGVNE